MNPTSFLLLVASNLLAASRSLSAGCQEGEIFFEFDDRIRPSTEGACRQCGFLATSSQAEELVAQEAKVEEYIQQWDRKEGSAAAYLTEDIAERLEENMAQLFSEKHWLRDRVARHLVAFYEAAGDAASALSFAKRCANFTAEVYPGFSALQAWSLETQGDLELRLAGFAVGPDSVSFDRGAGAAKDTALDTASQVCSVYEASTEALEALFGLDHEFVVAIREKRDALRRIVTLRRDTSGARLVRRLRQATSVVPPRSGLVDCVLSAGGTGGVGTIWAKHLNARSIIFLGRSPPSAPKGLLALEAAFQFAQPRFNVLMIGLDGGHPRFQPLTGGTGNLVASLNTTSVAGCIEIIQAAVRKILGCEAKLGDSFVQLGLDSMSSMSLHSNLCQASGISLPFSIFYDEPTVLQAASFLHRSAGGGDEEEDLESMLQDAEARRSYHLSQAKQLLASVETSDEEAKAARLKEALDICRKAVEGASGSALVVALALEAEIGTQLGLEELVATTRSLLAACEDAYGADSPDTAVALGKLIRASKAGEGGEAVRWVADFQRRHESFMRAISWVEAAGLATLGGNSQCVGAVSAVSFANVTMTLRTLNLDDQGLGKRVESIIWLSTLGNLEQLEVLKLRRNAICELPSTLGNLLKLRELYLTSNALSDLPQTYSNLSKLQVLYSLLPVDALYICDPANAWFLQDPSGNWKGLQYFEEKISDITSRYRKVFAWGGSMGGSAALLFANLFDRVHAFSPQVDLAYTWPSFATQDVREQFRSRCTSTLVQKITRIIDMQLLCHKQEFICTRPQITIP
eukprot:g8170.t1